jgi:cytochrome b subunit of formate dehydrogenase
MIRSYMRRLFVLLIALAAAGSAVRLNAQSSECLQCHSEPSLTKSKAGKTISLHVDGKDFAASAHGSLECTACHEGFKASDLPHAKTIKPVNCQGCHSDEQFEHYKNSIHGQEKNGKTVAACADCHSAHTVKKFADAPAGDRKRYSEITCAKCHAAQDTVYKSSEHAMALNRGVAGAPVCIDCHDEHTVKAVADTTSSTSRRNVAAMCLKCHRDDKEVGKNVNASSTFIASYEKSVHAHAVKSGKEEAAICIDCHGAHEMKKASDPTSRVAKKNIAGTCGGCHVDIVDQYSQSVHGKAVANGVLAAATCTDCHGEHNILSPKDANSPVAPGNVSAKVCSPCHASVKLASKFGLSSDRFSTFMDSYHGLANTAGSTQVANCASCHGIHNIKPSSDSTSSIAPANLIKTCGKCHPGSNANFTKGVVHMIPTESNDKILYYVSTGYILLIIVVVGGMFLHNLLDFVKKSRHTLAVRRGLVPAHAHSGHRLYLRMSLNERLQHASLLVSFITLVLTGFMLRFPDAWWVAPLAKWSPFVFDLRGVLHRIAAVVMVLASLYHVYYLFFTVRGKQLLKDLLPVPKDVTDAMGIMMYNLGIRKEKPLLDRFSYVEKAEYWALVWGTFVMAATGTILWFDNTFLGLLTKMWWDVARTVHYYEAWLATLAIIVWHFYFVIFNPDSYPINLAFLKGTLTEKEMEEEHPLELERLQKEEQAAERAEK